MLAHLMANRHTAAEVRTYQMRNFLLTEYQRIMRLETTAQLLLVRSQTATRLAGASVAGVATFAVYAVLGWLLLTGWCRWPPPRPPCSPSRPRATA